MAEHPGYGIIDRLEQDIARVLDQNQKLKEQNRQMASEIQKQKSIIAQQKAELAQLEKNLQKLLLKRSLTEVSGGVKAAKLRINRLVKEIDSCIALMNK